MRSDVAVKVFGDDTDAMTTTTQQIGQVMGKLPGATEVKVEQTEGLPALTLTVDRIKAARYGLNVADVQEAFSTLVGGRDVGMVFEGDRRFAITVPPCVVSSSRRGRYNGCENANNPMRYYRRTRFVAALVALFGLLFMQLAVAAYACPKLSPVQQQSTMLDASGQAMKDCSELDKQSPSLCQADSHQAPQSSDTSHPSSIQPFTAAGLFAHIVTADELIPRGFMIPAAFLHASSTAPPIAIRNCCFRL